MAETNCIGPCAPNEGSDLPTNQMPFFVQPGGGGGSFVLNVQDTDSIDLAGSGTQGDPLQASLKVSTTGAGNMVQVLTDGIYVPHEVPANGTVGQVLAKASGASYDLVWITSSGGGGAGSIVTANTSTTTLAGTGEASTPLTVTVKTSMDAGNGLEIRADGLWVAPGTPGPKGDTGDSIVPQQYGVLTDADITAITAADIDWVFLVNADNGGTQGDQRANQAIPAGITGDMAGHLIRYDGSDNTWSDLGIVAGVPGATGANGQGVPTGGATGQILVKTGMSDFATAWQNPPDGSVEINSSTTVLLGGDGMPGTALTASVIVDPDGTNTLTATANGLMAARELPTGGSTGWVLKKVNGSDFNVAWAAETVGLASVTTANSDNVTLTGNGQAGSALTAVVKVDPAANDNLLTSSAAGLKVSPLLTIVAKTLTAQTGILGDIGKYLEFTNAAAKSYTVPAAASAAFPAGTPISIFNSGAGDLTIVPDAGVTIIKSADQTFVLKQGKSASLVRSSTTNTWHLVGGMEAV